MRRLIWVFAGRTCNFVGNALARLICKEFEINPNCKQLLHRVTVNLRALPRISSPCRVHCGVSYFCFWILQIILRRTALIYDNCIWKMRKCYVRNSKNTIWTATWENVPTVICAHWRLIKFSCKFAQSVQTVRCPYAETLHHWPSIMRSVKILISLRGCTGWSKSSLGAHIRRYISWHCGLCAKT